MEPLTVVTGQTHLANLANLDDLAPLPHFSASLQSLTAPVRHAEQSEGTRLHRLAV